MDRRKPSFLGTKGYIYHVGCAVHFVAVLMAYLACRVSPQKLAIQDLPGDDASMWFGACGGLCFRCLSICMILSEASRCKTSWKKRDLIQNFFC